VIVSGQNWLDISHIEANKSYALKQLQHAMGFTPKETMVFGDYNNDIGMLKLADMSFAMENAHPNVKNTAKYQTSSNDDYGVESILEDLLAARS
jgi:hydroxymethylpyrimidine pyrophosphatase-like HAD family hydrolase